MITIWAVNNVAVIRIPTWIITITVHASTTSFVQRVKFRPIDELNYQYTGASTDNTTSRGKNRHSGHK